MAHHPQSTDFLAELNPAQRKAAEQIYGPVLVLAGPGTGKTHLLASRIAHILQETDARPENILCLTFTNAGAVEMRDRLQKEIGPTAYRLRIFTFHAFCEWVMDTFPETFQKKRKKRELADDLQKAITFREAVTTRKWEYFSNIWDPFFLRQDFLMALSKLKRENISMEEFRTLIPEEKERLEEDPENFYKRKFGEFEKGDFKPSAREKIDQKIEKMTEFVDLWESYEKKLAERGYFDFDDQIQWVVEELEQNKNLKLDLQEQFQWVLTDEYQDTNSAQNKILWLLSDFDDQPNLFVVGDDDQAIFRFQGASVVNIHDFQKKFPHRKEITLTENYRSAQNILDASFGVIAHNLDRLDPEKSLRASGKNKQYPGVVRRAIFGSRYTEINFLVEQIRSLLREKILPGEMAILVRKNSEVQDIARALPRFGIPVSAQIFENIFEDENVRHLIAMMQIFSSPQEDEKIFELLHSPFVSVEPHLLLRFWQELRKEKISAIELLEKKSEENKELRKFLDFFVSSRKNYWHCRPLVLAEKLLYESGLAKYISRSENDSSSRDWQKIQKFLEWISEQDVDTLPEILDRIQLHQDLQIPVRPDEMPSDRHSVHILTAHSAKGREFDVVFIPGLEDRKWGNPWSQNNIPLPHLFQDQHDENEDERRLFFVATTRARKHLFLSYAKTDFSGKEKNPSQFWHEIPENCVMDIPQDEAEQSLEKILPVFLSGIEKPLFTQNEKEILQSTVQKFVWSATSLQDFLECPRRFLYQRLYHFPRRPTPQMALGVALHEALEKFLRQFSLEKKLPSREMLLQEFERALRGQNIPKSEFDTLLLHGQEILSQYLDHKKDDFSLDHLLEFNFGKFHPDVDGIRITGKMDKVLFVDTTKTLTKIVDYKSGKPRPIREGEREWRQMVFYDLLARSCKGLGWVPQECELEFLTPDSRGKFGTRAMQVSAGDREKVIRELKDCHEKLLNLEFPLVENPDNDPDIDFWQNFGK